MLDPSEVFIGRRPLYHGDLQVAGYELVWNEWLSESGSELGAENQAAEAFATVLVDVGLDTLTSGLPAFLRIRPGWLSGNFPWMLPTDQMTLCIDEQMGADPALLPRLKQLSTDGFRIAVNTHREVRQQMMPALKLADYVIIDLQERKTAEVADEATGFAELDVTLVAANIRTDDDLDLCRRVGFDLFYGSLFSTPALVRGRRLPEVQLSGLRLLAMLRDPNVELSKLADIVSRDVFLSYKLLRFLNSAQFFFRKEVSSIQQAMSLLGLENVLNFVSVLVMSRAAPARADIVEKAFARARLCEALATATKQPQPADFFTAGLFSALDQVAGAPLDELIESLPLAESLRSALLKHEGVLGEALTCVMAYEQFGWEKVQFGDLDADHIRTLFVDSIRWTTKLQELLAA